MTPHSRGFQGAAGRWVASADASTRRQGTSFEGAHIMRRIRLDHPLACGTDALGLALQNVRCGTHRERDSLAGEVQLVGSCQETPPGDIETWTNYPRVMAERLERDCESIDDGRDFRWAVRADTIRWMSFVSFAALKSILLISGLIAESAATRILAAIALTVAFIAEELSADRVVIAANDSEITIFDTAPGRPRSCPTSVQQRMTFQSVHLKAAGLLNDRWALDDRDVRIRRTHRSTIEQWVSERPNLPVTSR